MKTVCEKCGKHLEPGSPEAMICSYECTFCTKCSGEMNNICPNCNGELVRRPARKIPVETDNK